MTAEPLRRSAAGTSAEPTPSRMIATPAAPISIARLWSDRPGEALVAMIWPLANSTAASHAEARPVPNPR